MMHNYILLMFASATISFGLATAFPLPYPLPANISFGQCGDLPAGVHIPGCTASVTLAAKVSVKCATRPGCDPSCSQSTFAQGIFSRYEARLSSGGHGGTPPGSPPRGQVEQMNVPQTSSDSSIQKRNQSRYWWRLNNTNCNLHDMHDMACPVSGGVEGCKSACEAHADCGGFLLYTKTGKMAPKNSTCWADIGPLPPIDAGDDLYVMHNVPEPSAVPEAGGQLSTVEVCVAGISDTLGPETDESYTLSVPSGSGTATYVRAKSIFGAMHGLESLTQLVDVRVGFGQPTTIPIAPVQIDDKPRFPFRGLMIDSGRHFLPLSHIKKTVVAASMVKLNVIHWHLVDSQSFATCSEHFPKLCEEGAYPNAYSSVEAESSISRNVSKAKYTPAELKELVAFAKSYGVRIQPEWDMPGHGAWGYGMPELVSSACSDALDVTRPELYTFMKTFLGEMASIFDEKYLFLGGDELATDCFENSPNISAWMKSHGMNASSTQQYFWQQMTDKVFPFLNKTISVWRADDPNRGAFASNLPPSSVLNVYQSLTTAWHQTLPGGTYTVVSMAGDRWYLDSEAGGYNQNSWKSTYNFNAAPSGRSSFVSTTGGSWFVPPNASSDQHHHMLGGETAMWGEGINKDNFDAFVWRAATAAAERLWTTEIALGCPETICPGVTAAAAAKGEKLPKISHWLTEGSNTNRLDDQLCRMSRFGIRTGPIAPGFCPSDEDSATLFELEYRHRLEGQLAQLRVQLAAALGARA